MFSKEEIRIVRIESELPSQEERESLIEQFISKYPLSTLKFDEIQDLIIKMKKTLDKIPTMILNGPNVSLSVTKEKLTLQIEKGQTTTISSEEKTSKEVKPFSENNLKRISDDFNFITAGILGILDLASLNTESYFRASKDIDRDLRFDAFFTPDFWSKFEECDEKYVSGLQIEYDKPVTGINAHHRIRLNSITKNSREKEVDFSSLFNFELKGPIDLGAIVKDRLETANVMFKKLTGTV